MNTKTWIQLLCFNEASPDMNSPAARQRTSKRRIWFAAVLLLGASLVACKEGQDQDVRLADKLAAHPEDPTKPAAVSGVPDARLQSGEAIEAAVKACVEAIKADPNEPRYEFELGRVLLLAGMTEDAREHLEAAAQRGHAGAYFYLGGLELETAKGFFQKASTEKFRPADRLVVDLKSIGVFEPQRFRWYLWLATAGGLVVAGSAVFLAIRLRRRRNKGSPQSL